MATTTPEAIRDRCITVIEALAPASDINTRFRRYNNEGGADFKAWAEGAPAACRRRFQVRTAGASRNPLVSNTDLEEHWITVMILVAYPQTSRDGKAGALDRDDTFDVDAFQIDKALGMLGKANFTPPTYPEACWHENSPGIRDRDIGAGVDFLEIEFVMFYNRVR